MKNKTILYKKARNHEISVWEIWSGDNTINIITRATKHSSGVHHIEIVDKGLAGRSLAEQVTSRINSRVQNKLDHGYVNSEVEARSSGLTNQLKLPMPMLAERIEKIKNLDLDDCLVQYKYDGHRCLIKIDPTTNSIVAYTRRGKEIHTIDHITEAMSSINEIILDGELYCHGESLQTIASWAKRQQPNTAKLEFYCYDAIIPGVPYPKRLERIKQTVILGKGANTVPTWKWPNSENKNIKLELHKARDLGYEGLILRTKDLDYEVGRRSKKLIKVKHWDDDEFIVHHIDRSRRGRTILHMNARNGKGFKAQCPGTLDFGKYVLNTSNQFIGKVVTVEYANLTKEGIPFQPIALRFHIEL